MHLETHIGNSLGALGKQMQLETHIGNSLGALGKQMQLETHIVNSLGALGKQMHLETHIGNLLGALGKEVEQQLISLNAAVNGNSLLSNNRASVHLPDSVKKTHADLGIPSLHRKGRLWDQQLEREGGRGSTMDGLVSFKVLCVGLRCPGAI